MANWFGKGCTHQCCRWEENEETGGPDYQETLPVLIHCGHDPNPEESEGNCSERNWLYQGCISKGFHGIHCNAG